MPDNVFELAQLSTDDLITRIVALRQERDQLLRAQMAHPESHVAFSAAAHSFAHPGSC